ncbi:MAG TPA: hypothetical protein VD999_01095 [Vitreimonas sp.]|nr:hypothetical protein [Vitreimonas sp.]
MSVPSLNSLALCASITFYQHVVEVKNQLQARNFEVVYPDLAADMEKHGDYNVENYAQSFYDERPLERRHEVIKEYFQRIAKVDAILVINDTKRGVAGYIGGNVLMEMAIAFHYDKKIFILNDIGEQASFKDEILAMKPVFLQGDLANLPQLE